MATTYDNASLVMIPSGVKESKLYSIKPTDGSGDFTFSRGTDTATRVNASGLIEKERGNLLLQSNTFDTTWTTSNASVTGGQSGYDGSNDAWLLNITGGSSDQRISQNVQYSGVSTLSVYAKKNDSNWLSLRIGSSVNKWYDLENGVLGGSTILTAYIDASIEDVGSGWYRCTLTFTDNSNTSTRIYPAENDLDITQTSGSIYIQDAQVESGLVATDYIETTTAAVYEGITDNLPRLDYSGGASCPSLLLEPSRTNSIPQSDYFGAWNSFSSISLSNNAGTSPEGVTNATEITWGASGSRIQYDFPHNATSATYSVFVKSNGGSSFNILLRNVTTSTNIAEEIFTGATFQPTLDTNSPISVDYGNGWYRVSITATSGITSGNTLRTYIYADNGGELLIYGAQCETGSYPTSYIPTYGTSASRAADKCNDSTASDLISATEGVMFLDADLYKKTDTEFYYAISDGTLGNSIYLHQAGQSLFVNKRISSATESASVSPSDWSSGRNKIAVKYSTSELKIFVNGVLETTESITGIATGMDSVTIGSRQDSLGALASNAVYRQALLFKTALTDAECIALTTI